MELEFIKWVLMGLITIVVYFVRQTAEDAKEDIKTLKSKAELLEQTKLSKDDFKEFKIEFREMINELKTDIREQLKNHG